MVNDRIDVRISKEQKELIKYASELGGFKSLSEFIIFCVSTEANRIILENHIVLKSRDDQKKFFNAISNPPTPNEQLKRAQSRYVNKLKNGFSD